MIGQSASAVKVFDTTTMLALDTLTPNPWNPNEMDQHQFTELCESIRVNGFLRPLTVINLYRLNTYRVLDGEQRLDACKKLGIDPVPCIVIGNEKEISEAQQRSITLSLNSVHGDHDPEKVIAVLGEIESYRTPNEPLFIPYLDFTVAPVLLEQDLKPTVHDRLEGAPRKERHIESRRTNKEQAAWQVMQFRMPPEVAEVVNQALERVMGEQGFTDDWQALEVLAADYLAG